MIDAVKVDIWSDIACPWCYIGKRRFEAGVALFGGRVEIEYHSYEMDPTSPVDFEGTALQRLAERKRISIDQAQELVGQISSIAVKLGLFYDYESLRPTNTLRAHELLHFAKAHGRQVDMKERLLSAFFVEGRHVGKLEELADLAASIGLDREFALRSLESREFVPAVELDKATALEYGIQGIPYFVVEGKYGISGAQEPVEFLKALEAADREKVVKDG